VAAPFRRAIVVVMDSVGIGELPDARSFIPTNRGTVTPESQPTPVSWLVFDT